MYIGRAGRAKCNNSNFYDGLTKSNYFLAAFELEFEILSLLRGSVTFWHSSLESSSSSSSSSSLKAQVKYLTEYEKGCCWPWLSKSPCCCCCCLRFCFLFGFKVLDEVARGGRGKHTWITSSSPLRMSPVGLRPSWFIRKTILRGRTVVRHWGRFFNCCRNTFHHFHFWLRCTVAIFLCSVLLFPLFVAQRPRFGRSFTFVACTAAAVAARLGLIGIDSWRRFRWRSRSGRGIGRSGRFVGSGIGESTNRLDHRNSARNGFCRFLIRFSFRLGFLFTRVFFLLSTRTLIAITWKIELPG